MCNMPLCMAHLLVVFDFSYLQNSASSGVKTSFSDQQWLYFHSCLLSFKDIKHWRPPKDAPWNAAYFTYQARHVLSNIVGLKEGNRRVKTGIELAGSVFSFTCYSRNRLKMELMRTLNKDSYFIIKQSRYNIYTHQEKWPYTMCNS